MSFRSFKMAVMFLSVSLHAYSCRTLLTDMHLMEPNPVHVLTSNSDNVKDLLPDFQYTGSGAYKLYDS